MLFWQLQTVSNVVTIVSAFYNIEKSFEAIAEASAVEDFAFDDVNANYTKHEITEYTSWFNNTVCISTRYIVFGDNISANMIKNVRDRGKCGVTEINPLPIHQLSTYKYLCKLSRDFGSSTGTDRPLFLLGVVWVSKFELVVRASKLQPSQQWFAWVDAGINSYRDRPPPPGPWPWSPKVVENLPRDRIIVGFVAKVSMCNIPRVTHSDYCIAGTAWLAHRDALVRFRPHYRLALRECYQRHAPHYRQQVVERLCLDDQVLMTIVLERRPDLFFALTDSRLWGQVALALYRENHTYESGFGGEMFLACVRGWCGTKRQREFSGDKTDGPTCGARSRCSSASKDRPKLPLFGKYANVLGCRRCQEIKLVEVEETAQEVGALRRKTTDDFG